MENLVNRKYQERMNTLPEHIQNQIREKKNKDFKSFQLRTIKKSNSKPNIGDVFVYSPRENIYFYGKVIENCIVSKDKLKCLDGHILVALYPMKSRTVDMSGYRNDCNKFLIPPIVVRIDYWKKGYFYTVENVKEPNVKEPTYGFYSMRKQRFVNIYYDDIDYTPEYFDLYALATSIAVGTLVETEFIIDPDLLVF